MLSVFKKYRFVWRGALLSGVMLCGVLAIRSAVLAGPPVGAADLDQIRNGKFNDPNQPAHWVNGNAGFQNAHYLEGHSIGYRAKLTDVPTGVQITIVLGYDIKHSGKHALDFLTDYQRLEPHDGFATNNHGGVPSEGETVDPTIKQDDLAEAFPGLEAKLNDPPDDTIDITCPSNAMAACLNVPQSERVLSIWNGGFVGGSFQYVDEGNIGDSKSEAQISVTFEADTSTVVLGWGGHIAMAEDWGEGNSASAVNGSPYHMRLKDWEDGPGITLTNLGNQDRSLKADAVFSPPVCSVNCDDEVCVGEDSTECCVQVTDGIEPYSYSWTGPNSFTSDQQCVTISNAQLADASPPPYSVVVTDDIGLISSQDCSFELIVNANPTCDPDDICLGEVLSASCSGGSGGYTCTWSGPGTIPSADGACSFTPDQPGTFSVTCKDSEDCVSDSCSADVIDPPTSDAGPDDAKCMDDTSTTCFSLDGTVTNGDPSWEVLSQSTDPSSCSITFSPSADVEDPSACFAAGCTGTATLRLTSDDPSDDNCPPATDDVDLEVYELPTATPTGASECVDAADPQVHAGEDDGQGPYKCAWSGTGAACLILANADDCDPFFDLDHASCGVGTWALHVDVTDDNECTGGGDTSVTVSPLPICTPDPFDFAIETPQVPGGADGTLLASGIALGEPSTSCTATLVAATGAGWTLGTCSVSGSDVRVTYDIDVSTGTASPSASIDITLKTADNCTDVCVGNVLIPVQCEVDPPANVCDGENGLLTARVVAGECDDRTGQLIDWFGPFDPSFDCGTLGGTPLDSCDCLCTAGNIGDCPAACTSCSSTCDLSVSNASATKRYCALNTELNGFEDTCTEVLNVFPNPTCNITGDTLICDVGETSEFCATPSGGTGDYTVVWRDNGGAGSIIRTCTQADLDADSGRCCINVSSPDTYKAFVTDSAPVIRPSAPDHCFGNCSETLEVENCRCRVTGGGNDGRIPPKSWADGEFGDNQWTIGGQAGAPSASSPAFGEWTHHQKRGSFGRFVFHGGTASAPSPETFVENIRCSDPENCHPARPAPSKQIAFDGVGTIKNGKLEASDSAREFGKDDLLCFFVEIEDLGEPGNRTDNDETNPTDCPFDGHPSDGSCDKCGCADWYSISIVNCHGLYGGPTSEEVYHVRGYLHGGNFQIHPLVGETYDGPSCGD